MGDKSKRSKRPRRDEDDQNALDQSVTDLEESINKCVRYLLYVGQADVPVKQADIVKNVLRGSRKSYELIVKEAGKQLEKIYGCKLINFEDGATKYHLLICDKGQINRDDDSELSDAKRVLTMLILTHIFMSNNTVNEGSMDAFLSSLDVDVNKNHHLFGNVKEFLNTVLVKRKFLKVSVDDVTRKSTYSWGPRAEVTVSKNDILEFVCKVYRSKKDLQPSAWETQFKEARKQQLAFDRENSAENN